MKKIISAVSAIIFTAVSSAAVMYTGAADEQQNEQTVRIMCIGDSITDGYTNDYVGSYRKFIYHDLVEMGCNVDMVGSKGGGWTPTYTDSQTGESFEFDNDNTGYSGYSISSYSGRTGIYETLQQTGCLDSEKPDIVTLQIGTNDVIDNYEINSAGERLEIVVDYILDNISEDSALFISPIPALDPNRSDVYSWFGNYRHSADWQIQYDDAAAEANVQAAVESYNAQVKSLAEKKKSEGKNVYYSDAALKITDVSAQLFDGVHPNNTGYKLMGERWAEIIGDYLNIGSDIPTTKPTTISTTTTITTATTIKTETSTSRTETTATEIPPATTTDIGEENAVSVADLVKLSRFLLADRSENYSEAELKLFDMDNDGIIDVYDLIKMRRALLKK